MSNRILTTAAGAPVGDNQNSITAGPRGPIALQDFWLIEKLAHFDREVIPERRVHAKGSGAFGTLKITHDISRFTKAKVFAEVGKQTPLFLRFSTVAGERGAADAERDVRGFSIKFYTEEGNWDVVGNNTPVFFIRDPLKFPDFIHTQKRDPATNLKSPTAVWDFASLSPETVHQFTILFSDRGTPASYRHMDGFSSHTFSWINAADERVWVKYHFKTRQGIRNFTAQQAATMAGIDPDHATRDLYASIQDGDFPSWRVCVQILTEAEAANLGHDPFDLTKVWSQKTHPLIEIGELTLNRNPENFFAETEQAAFTPANVVPGIGFSPDKMLQGRLFAYGDAHRYRLGANYAHLPVNRPHATSERNYQRDGALRFDGNGGGAVNYEPNSFGGPKQTNVATDVPSKLEGATGRYDHHEGNDDFTQAGDLYRLLTVDERARLVANLVGAMKPVPDAIKRRQIEHFRRADAEYGAAVAKGLGLE